MPAASPPATTTPQDTAAVLLTYEQARELRDTLTAFVGRSHLYSALGANSIVSIMVSVSALRKADDAFTATLREPSHD